VRSSDNGFYVRKSLNIKHIIERPNSVCGRHRKKAACEPFGSLTAWRSLTLCGPVLSVRPNGGRSAPSAKNASVPRSIARPDIYHRDGKCGKGTGVESPLGTFSAFPSLSVPHLKGREEKRRALRRRNHVYTCGVKAFCHKKKPREEQILQTDRPSSMRRGQPPRRISLPSLSFAVNRV